MDGLTFSVTTTRTSYASDETLNIVIANSVAMKCFETHKTFCSHVCCGRLVNLKLEEFLSMIKAEFGLREFNRDKYDRVDSNWTSEVRLIADDRYVFVTNINKLAKEQNHDDLRDEVDAFHGP